MGNRLIVLYLALAIKTRWGDEGSMVITLLDTCVQAWGVVVGKSATSHLRGDEERSFARTDLKTLQEKPLAS